MWQRSSSGRWLCASLVVAWSVALVAAPLNVLLIVSEDNGPELGCYGDPYVKTPVLDRLAETGIRFANAYVPQAGCSQSRAAYFTGLYPHQNGQIGLATWKFRLYRNDTPNLIRSLKSAGYRTGLIGKLHVNPADAFPFDFRAMRQSNFARKEIDQYAIQAKKFIESSDAPFFLSVNYPDAHRPFLAQIDGIPKEPLQAKDVRPLRYFGIDTPELRQQTADYYNCMNRLDDLIGDLLAVVRASGKWDNTLIIYLGDHGADMLRGKRTSYEGGVKIPLIVRWPGSVSWNSRGRVVEELVSTLDLFPTILDVVGETMISNLSGRSLLPLLENPDAPWRRYLFTEFHIHSAHNFYPQRTVRDERFKLIQNCMPGEVNPGVAFTHARFFSDLDAAIHQAPDLIRNAYARMRQPDEFELYDLQDDPHEFKDLIDNPEYREASERLKRRLAQWRKETSDPLLDRASLDRLRSEVDACFEEGQPNKSKLTLSYPEYFFSKPEVSK